MLENKDKFSNNLEVFKKILKNKIPLNEGFFSDSWESPQRQGNSRFPGKPKPCQIVYIKKKMQKS